MSCSFVDEPDISVVSYRSHHHTFDEQQANVKREYHLWSHSPIQRIIQFLFCFTMIHYFLWCIVMIGSVVMLYVYGYWLLSLVLVLSYLPSFLNGDQLNSGRPWHSFRQHWLWSLVHKYLQVEVVRLKKLDPSQPYIFGIYPHGILILSRVMSYGGIFEKLFPGIETRVLGATPMFYVPGSREICLWMGAVDANRRTAENALLKYNKSLMVYPGGSSEIFLTDPNSPLTTLVGRKGFIKLAIQSGAHLVPTFVFGEKWIYHKQPLYKWITNFFMRTLRLPLIIFWGRYFTWLPYHDNDKTFLSMVYGEPIPVEKCAQPTQQQIDTLYNKYMDATIAIYETYKHRYGYPADEHIVIQHQKEKHHEKKKDK